MTKDAFILNFFKLYNMLWKLGLPFLKTDRRLREGFEKRRFAAHHSKADIWIQAASAGEAHLAANIIQTLKPTIKIKILITSTTSQGVDILKTRLKKQTIHHLIKIKIEWFPFDMPETVKKAVININPSIMVLLETEIWPALLYYLKQNRSKILIINARLSKKSFNNYMKTRFFWKHLSPDIILATSSSDAEKYRSLFNNATIKTMLNIKFDSIGNNTFDSNTQKQIKTILPGALPITIFASIRGYEEREVILILKKILNVFPNQIIAVFPRHMHRIRAWKKLLNSHHLKFYLKSTIVTPLINPGIIIWDTFGELQAACTIASIVFVGGSLKPLGGQNFLEPASTGAVTVTGPYYDDFAWSGDDIFKHKIVIKKNSWQSVAETIIQHLDNPADRKLQSLKAQKYITSHQGGTLQACNEILKQRLKKIKTL